MKAEAKPEVKAEAKTEVKPAAKTTKAAAKTTKTAKKTKYVRLAESRTQTGQRLSFLPETIEIGENTQIFTKSSCTARQLLIY